MTIQKDSTLREVAFEVCTALEKARVTAVLTGGSAATVYAPEAVQSFDLDFIVTFRPEGGSAGQVLEELGFHLEGQDYRHDVSPFQLEFPLGPLAVGDELIETWETMEEGDLLLHILTPTDSCRDRLASFYHFHDRSALEQARAVAVATSGRVDLAGIRAWSEREGRVQECREFLRLVATPEDVFARYTHGFDFDTTRCVVRLFEYGTRFVSRSEAKRLVSGLTKFREVILDFQGVQGVGQGFVDEVFRVWARAHPQVTLTPRGMNAAVEFMVRRGLPR